MSAPDALLRELRRAVGAEHVLDRPADLLAYEMDGTIDRAAPDAVVFPDGAEQVRAVVRACAAHGVPLTPRGAGTGLSGGAVATRGGVVLATARMRRILSIDPVERVALVEPGVPNVELSEAAAAHGLFYAPDPSSQKACTIGGNVAENAGGPHCLALGVTTNHVIGMEVVTADGEIEWLGSLGPEPSGYDLRGLFVGSEGTLGVATRIAARLLPVPDAVVTLLAIFADVEAASETVSAVIGAGLAPAALEMIDRVTLRAAEAGLRCGYPPDAGAVLLIELDGIGAVAREQAERAEAACRAHGASEVRRATDPVERERLWKGRKGAIGALGRIAPNYYLLDGVVPRSRLVATMRAVADIAARHRFPVANVFHAGDGNLHPCLLFDEREEGATARVLEAGAEIMRVCVEAGGALTGEHGVGFEKRRFMPWLYGGADLENMGRVRGVFGNEGGFNPCKVLPEGTGCGEMAGHERAVAAAGPGAWV